MEDTVDCIKRVIGDTFDVVVDDLSEDSLLSEFISDDFDLSEFRNALIDEFACGSLNDATVEEWASIADVVSYLMTRTGS